MKKVLITLAIISAIILAIPLVGNKLIESTIDNQVEVLASYGLKVKDSSSQSSYLSSKKHYIFVVEDSKSFVSYLNQFSDKQLPLYVDALVDGAEVGFDVKYSNIPIEDKVSIDIYPNALSTKMAQDLKSNDASFYAYVEQLLKNKSILYHLNYDALNDSFDGYIKDIDESQILEDGSKLSLKVQDATFEGKGLIIAPDALSSKIKELALGIKMDTYFMMLEVNDFISSSVFESKTTYKSNGSFSKIKWTVKSNKKADVDLDMQNLAFDFSSNTQNVKANFSAKLSFDAMDIKTSATSIKATKFNYDVALRDVSKDSYEKLISLINQLKVDTSDELQNEIIEVTYELMARGMTLEMVDLSIKDVSTSKTKNLGGMSLKSAFTFKEDKNLVSKIKTNPMSILNLVDIDLMFKVSKGMYSKLALASPMMSLAKNFAKEDKELLTFEIQLKDSQLSVNGRGIN